jgi:hypothetical protein
MKKIEIKYQIPGFLIIIVIAFFAFKFGKPYLQHERLEYRIQKLINYRQGPLNTKPDIWEVKDQIAFKARQLGLPLQTGQIQVNELDDILEVSLKYTYIVDLHFKKVPLHFQSLLRTEI